MRLGTLPSDNIADHQLANLSRSFHLTTSCLSFFNPFRLKLLSLDNFSLSFINSFRLKLLQLVPHPFSLDKFSET